MHPELLKDIVDQLIRKQGLTDLAWIAKAQERIDKVPRLMADTLARGQRSFALEWVEPKTNVQISPAYTFAFPSWTHRLFFCFWPRPEWLQGAARLLFDYLREAGLDPYLSRVMRHSHYGEPNHPGCYIMVRCKTADLARIRIAMAQSLASAAMPLAA